jgi:hypothetical protein
MFRTLTLGARKQRNSSTPLSITDSLERHVRNIFSGILKRQRDNDPVSIIESLERHKGRLANLVRHLVVPSNVDKTFVSAKTILRIMKSAKNLTSFSWNANHSIPSSVLAALHRDHPSVRLMVTSCNRQGHPLDEALLSSPQLHTLDLTVSCTHRGIYHLEEGICELTYLKALLVRGGNLKVLRLRLIRLEPQSEGAKAQFKETMAWAAGPFNFRFEETDEFPTLEELVILQGGSYEPAYELSAKHCSDWSYAMDWSEMRVLNLGSSDAEHLLPEITGLVPKLHTLRFNPSSINHNILQSFLDSLPQLKDLTLVAGETSHVYVPGFDTAVTKVCSTVGSQLHTLHIDCEVHLAKSWLPGRFQEILGLCPQLRCFESVVGPQLAIGEWGEEMISMSACEKYGLMEVNGTVEPGMMVYDPFVK